MKKILALIVMLSFTCAPLAFAQETGSAVIPEVLPAATVPVVESVPDTAIDPVPEASDIVAPAETVVEAPTEFDATNTPAASATSDTDPTIVQDTAPTQESVPVDELEATVDPESATTTESEVILVVATTSSPAEIPVAPETEVAVVEDISSDPTEEVTEISEEISISPSVELDIVSETLVPEVQTITNNIELLEDEDPKYVIQLSGNTIPTKKRGILGASSLIVPTATSIDSTTGTMTVSGTCASPYFVVLIFKNQDDYETDPRSFIMNKAFPCVDGTYSYSIDRLPATLPNGTYYLMVGEQGISGPWTPATGLTEISINRSN
ncbi:MAG: hypothetical protein KBD06_02475 [Candidatus Pacebacteria bacterium]|nr:hypothetical protein [Candidatus Paceibacterota bacterium]